MDEAADLIVALVVGMVAAVIYGIYVLVLCGVYAYRLILLLLQRFSERRKANRPTPPHDDTTQPETRA